MRESVHLIGLPGLKNVGLVDRRLFRIAWPLDARGYRTMSGFLGVRYRLNLRSAHDDTAECKAVGIENLRVKMTTLVQPSLETVMRAVNYMRDPALRPMAVGCAEGQDRTGAAVAIFHMIVHGWTLDMVEEDMQQFILSPFGEAWPGIRAVIKEAANGL